MIGKEGERDPTCDLILLRDSQVDQVELNCLILSGGVGYTSGSLEGKVASTGPEISSLLLLGEEWRG